MPDMNAIVGTHDLLLMTLDTLRYDVAQEAHERDETPNLSALLPPSGWEARHSPASFTYAAHHAFFAGFLPTPTAPGPHPRLFATAFGGSETTTAETYVVDAADIVGGLAAAGYRTLGIGGVGFFNPATPLGRVLPSLFQTFVWRPELGVTAPDSAASQFQEASRLLSATHATQPVLLFINVAALHQPNCHYLPGASEDSVATHAAALRYVDSQLPTLLAALRRRARPWFGVLTSDHGTTYGEDGYTGHRLAHPVVWTVPFSTFTLAP